MDAESAADLLGMFDDFAVPATWRPASGSAMPVAVIRGRTDAGDGFTSTSRETADLPRLALAAPPAHGDELIVGADLFVVEAADLDPSGAIWRLTLSR